MLQKERGNHWQLNGHPRKRRAWKQPIPPESYELGGEQRFSHHPATEAVELLPCIEESVALSQVTHCNVLKVEKLLDGGNERQIHGSKKLALTACHKATEGLKSTEDFILRTFEA